MAPSPPLSKGDTAMILLTKIILPTSDIVTDILAIYQVFLLDQGRYAELFIIGYLMIFFLLLSFLLTIPHFVRNEKSTKDKLIALPWLMLLSWPQYRAIRLLWLAFVDGNVEQFLAEKMIFEQDVGNIGKQLKHNLNRVVN